MFDSFTSNLMFVDSCFNPIVQQDSIESIKRYRVMKLSLLLILVVGASLSAKAGGIPSTRDLASAARTAASASQLVVLYVTRVDCPYCTSLEKDILDPAYNSGELADVHFVELTWNDETVRDFDGKQKPASEMVDDYGIHVTPTMLFLGYKGEELTDRLVGYQSKDFQWSYIQSAINSAKQALLENSHSPKKRDS
ncbi:MAG TPA: hypothetical protein EYQ14_20355 [Gammaproteobacteria bacterium]|nr:hypothetical protein [Gammaproteobacteria bacterium]HIL97000.1 hypothetical protein [Pseudomonadales bacterium]